MPVDQVVGSGRIYPVLVAYLCGMWIRMIIVLLGLVVMINGCNSLISQHFGTHKLHELSLADIEADGIKDADFVRVNDAVLSAHYLVGPALRTNDKDYHLHAIIDTERQAALEAGKPITVHMVGWYKLPYADCVKNGDCFPSNPPVIQGLVTLPTIKKNPVAQWSEQQITLAEDVIYLQLWKEPLAWYWNLLFFLGGIALALGVEAWWQKRRNVRTE